MEQERGYPELRQVVIDCRNAHASAEFYRQLLGFVYKAGHEPQPDGDANAPGMDWLNLRDVRGTTNLAFQQVDELHESTWPDKSVPQQLHLDLTVPSVEDLDTQHERVLGLGGSLLYDRSDDPEEQLRVYADPDGHPFCIIVAPPPEPGRSVASVHTVTIRSVRT